MIEMSDRKVDQGKIAITDNDRSELKSSILEQINSKNNAVKPLAKRLEIFYEDDIDDDYVNEFQGDDEEKDSDENLSVDSDHEIPQIFSNTLQ